MFGTPTPEKPTDGAGYIAVPDRGDDHGDLDFTYAGEKEIVKLEKEIQEAKEGGYGDIAFLEAKLQVLKDSIENTTE